MRLQTSPPDTSSGAPPPPKHRSPQIHILCFWAGGNLPSCGWERSQALREAAQATLHCWGVCSHAMTFPWAQCQVCKVTERGKKGGEPLRSFINTKTAMERPDQPGGIGPCWSKWPLSHISMGRCHQEITARLSQGTRHCSHPLPFTPESPSLSWRLLHCSCGSRQPSPCLAAQ